MPIDHLSGKGAGSTDSGVFFKITPNDAADLAYISRAIVVTAAGPLHYVDVYGLEDTVTLPEGQYMVRLRKVFATGTTASVLGIR